MVRRIISIGRYKGGKVELARKILPFLPPAETYIEPFGGLYTLGLNYTAATQRYYCDLNPRTHNLLAQIQQQPKALMAAISGQPRSRASLAACWETASDALEDAARYYWICQSTFTGGGTRWSSGVTQTRAACCESHKANHLGIVSARLRGTFLGFVDGLSVLLSAEVNQESTLAYLDPTYTGSSRRSRDSRHKTGAPRSQYAVETDQGELLTALGRFKGMAVLSGYDNPEYNAALPGWQTVDIATRNAVGDRCIERLWINPAAWSVLARQLSLFA